MNIDHSTHEHEATTAARTACREEQGGRPTMKFRTSIEIEFEADRYGAMGKYLDRIMNAIDLVPASDVKVNDVSCSAIWIEDADADEPKVETRPALAEESYRALTGYTGYLPSENDSTVPIPAVVGF
jgi:hypothetical protein